MRRRHYIAAAILLLIKGTQESAIVNAIIVIIKVAIVLAFIAMAELYQPRESYSIFDSGDALPPLSPTDRSIVMLIHSDMDLEGCYGAPQLYSSHSLDSMPFPRRPRKQRTRRRICRLEFWGH